MKSFSPASNELFFTKNDPNDVRLGDLFKPAQLDELKTSEAFCLLGYPDDEGIKLNGGRSGAAAAPEKIRQILYKMTPSQKTPARFVDLGDLLPSGSTLPERHSFAAESIFKLQSRRIKTISLGGGHDYGYPDASGFLKAYASLDQRPLVVNFDAHLDVRPVLNGFNSGTPFFRLLSDPEFTHAFDFAEVGIQPQCNSPEHRAWAELNGAQIFNLSDIRKNGLMSLFKHKFFSGLSKRTPVFVSFDIDALTSSEAGGCSQSWATGLKVDDCLTFLNRLSATADVRGLGIYEVSPPLDTDHRTSKTAALLIYNFLFPESI